MVVFGNGVPLVRSGRLWLRTLFAAILAASIAGAPLPAAAIDLTGRSVAAEGNEDLALAGKPHEKNRFVILVYFGTKGNRFALMGKGLRVVIPPGKNSGSIRYGEFVFTVTLDQRPSSLGIKVRSTSSGGYEDLRVFDVALTETSCTVKRYRHTPDSRINYVSQKATAGACSIGRGQPKILDGK